MANQTIKGTDTRPEKPSSAIKKAADKIELLEKQFVDLEKTLKWFQDQSGEVRELMRTTINVPDVGYITSLLDMMVTSERQYEKWLAFTTRKFTKFKRRTTSRNTRPTPKKNED